MTTIYFITNNYLLDSELKYFRRKNEEEKRSMCPLSFKGEKKASELLKYPELTKVNTIYSSNYISAIGSAKYLSEELKLPIYVDERLRERKVGELDGNTEEYLVEMQEQDIDYKFYNGESIHMVRHRMTECLRDIIFHEEDETVAVFTHDIALQSLLTIWCEKGYSLENQLIFNFDENVIIDSIYHPFRIFKLEFNEDGIQSIVWENEKEL